MAGARWACYSDPVAPSFGRGGFQRSGRDKDAIHRRVFVRAGSPGSVSVCPPGVGVRDKWSVE